MNLELSLTPPNNIQAEQAVLGYFIFGETEQFAKIKDEYFYREDHKEIFGAIKSLIENRTPVDAISVVDELSKRGTLEKLGGLKYLNTLTHVIPSITNIKTYIDIITLKAFQRKAIKIGNSLMDTGYQWDSTLDELKIYMASLTKIEIPTNRGAIGMSDLLFTTQESIQNKSKGIRGTFYFKKICNMLGYMESGDMILISGKTSHGKTAFTLELVLRNLFFKKRVLFYSCEMTNAQVGKRMLSNIGQIQNSRMRHEEMEQSDWDKISKASQELFDKEFYVNDTSGITIEEIYLEAQKYKPDIIAIDYIQLLSTSKKYNSKAEKVGAISLAIKTIAKDLECSVIILSQKNKEDTTRWADEITMDCDVWLDIINNSFDNESERYGEEHSITIHCRKGRNAIGGWETDLKFYTQTQRFESR